MKNFISALFASAILFSCNHDHNSVPKKYIPAERQLPAPGAYVEDSEGSLTYDSTGENMSYNHIALLDSTIQQFRDKTGNEIAIVTVADIRPYSSLQQYAMTIGNQWGVGQKDKNNGLVIAVSAKMREVFISTGKGTQKIITDSICNYIVDTKMLPQFQKGHMYEGVRDGLNHLISTWTQLETVSPQ
ncbi:MAG: TPM domain-containing protein [Bacteroidia bacterium]